VRRVSGGAEGEEPMNATRTEAEEIRLQAGRRRRMVRWEAVRIYVGGRLVCDAKAAWEPAPSPDMDDRSSM